MSARRAGRPRWRDAALVLLALALIVVLRNAEPGYEEKLAPIMLQGSADLERIEARNFAVDVRGFKLARAYLVAGPYHDPKPKRVSTSGVWLSVVADVEALQSPGQVDAYIRTRDGLKYRASRDRPNHDANLGTRMLAPLLPERGAWFFELPPDRLQGAHLEVFWGVLGVPGRVDHVVDIDLGIDDERAQALLDEAPPLLDLRG
jgi:hypothetical protein